MSTAQANLFEWKQEVNRRLAEHRSRRGAPSSGPRSVDVDHRGGSRRGAEAAARVAQRFAHAPSYRDILLQQPQIVRADETCYAPLAVEVTAESPAAEFEPVSHLTPAWHSAAQANAPVAVDEIDGAKEHAPFLCDTEPREDAQLFSGGAEALWPLPQEPDAVDVEQLQSIEAESIHANLIEFPRELVATRKIRPRLVEGPLASTRNAQLSIFEVDPEAISTQAEPAELKTAPDWNQPEWSGIRLDPQPEEESPAAAEAAVAFAAAQQIEQAPVSRRLLALFVDMTFITAALIAAGAISAFNAAALPGPRQMGISALFGFAAAAVLYELIFLTLAQATPGMRYAQISLATFANEQPTREQRQRRLAITALSVLPIGLGLVWSLFDEERLCWHDRLSQTYLRCN